MSLLTPLALLGAAIVGPLIVAMYLLKLRREDRPVSSTFLWQRMVRDVEANAPWQKLRRSLLLLLQLLQPSDIQQIHAHRLLLARSDSGIVALRMRDLSRGGIPAQLFPETNDNSRARTACPRPGQMAQ